jgi:hypothetical protein
MFTSEKMIEVFDGMLAMDAGGWHLWIVTVNGLSCGDDVMT